MAKVYFITGSLGSGKTLAGINMVRQYLEQGRRVATNVNLNLEYLCGADNSSSKVIRVPDAPGISDLRAIGFGSSEMKDERHGLLLLDELGTWFNARDFASKGRLEVVKWMIHMRKRRWDVVFIVQDFSMVDKQARGNIAQYLVTCQNSKTMWLFKPFPKFHTGTVRMTATKMITERWIYRGADLYKAYDTEQLFHTGIEDGIIDADADMSEAEKRNQDKNGLYCVLPPAYFAPEKREEIKKRFDVVNRNRRLVAVSFLAVVVACVAFFLIPSPVPAVASEPVVEEGAPVEVQRLEQTSQGTRSPVSVPASKQGIDKFISWEVRSYSYIGGQLIRADFTNGREVADLSDLRSQGLKVSYSGPRAIRVADASGVSVVLRLF